MNFVAYETPDYADLAAAYAFGVAKNRPFVDGNKRAAFLGAGLFPALNGYRLTATQVDATRTMLAPAAGEIEDADLARWIRDHATRR